MDYGGYDAVNPVGQRSQTVVRRPLVVDGGSSGGPQAVSEEK
jgi:hypothetical protein